MKLTSAFRLPLILLTASLGLAAQNPPAANSKAAQDKADVKPAIAAQSKARAQALKAGKAKATAKAKLVDINGATKDELKKLPGITDAYAAKIIAGRPYRTKAHLVTHDILPAALYETLKKLIYAKQDLSKR